ncbi:hypothetical protein SAMN04487928_10178 [Butyrivibrio proteoclasticus]|uniref:Uncharacterized protein n=1 Tax=Butyrivibrio proteoclasticus TaxID=43305 RepID=A0A1I5PPV8_9FIRM|nr:hypothetical protein [Butyrivibrio proteoclasticus]SFP35596.1 hypothetical protein SAMN04487928_10178 [Butyrivibrio proteoclasticus]
MNKIFAVFATVVFIAGVVFFTFAELNKDNTEEPETYAWMKVFSIIIIILGVVLAIACRNNW